MVDHVAAAKGLNDLKESCHSCLLRARRRQLRRALVANRRRLPVWVQLLLRLGPVPAQLVGRVLDPGRRVRPRGRTLGVRRPWRQLWLRQALEKARLVGDAGAPAAVHGLKRLLAGLRRLLELRWLRAPLHSRSRLAPPFADEAL